MDKDDWDLFSIVRSYKETTFATPTTDFETPPPTLTTTSNNNISPQNTTPPCFDDFSFTEDNSSTPITPLKPNDFIELDKLIISSNPTTTIATPTITNIPTITTTPTTTPTPSSTTIPSHITTNTIINTSFHDSNQNSTFYNFPTLIEQQQLQQNEFTELEKMILKFYPNTTIPTSTITARTPTTTIFTTHTTTIPTTTFATLSTTTPIIPTITTTMTNTSVCKTNQYLTNSDYQILIGQEQNQPNRNNEVYVSEPHTRTDIATNNFDCAFNHPSIPQQPLRKRNQLPFLLPRTNSRFLPNTHPKKSKFKSRKRKNKNQVTFVCHVREDEPSEDSWTWKKYGEKPIKGSPHPRSYYKCRSFWDCSAKKLVEKSKTSENTYVVTYKGEHNHKKPEVNQNSVVGTSRNKSSETRLCIGKDVGSCPNVRNLELPNMVMLPLDQPESNEAQVLTDQSEIPYLKAELIESRLPTYGEATPPPNVGKLGSPNMMMLQFDEPKSSKPLIFTSESEVPYTSMEFIGSSDDDVILIPNMTPMLEDLLMDFNQINSGATFP